MAGLPEVAAGQGSGLSWMAPGSTFDPVTYATQALNAKLKGKSDEDKLAEQTAKLAEFKPGEQFNIDLTTSATEDVQGIQNYMKEQFMANKDNPYNLNTKMDLQKRVADAKLKDERRQTQYKDYQNVKKLLDADKGTQFHSDKMNRNLAFYEDPERFKDMPGFQKYRTTYDEIVTNLQKDPYYKTNPNRLLNDARIEFRDKTKNDLLGPVLKPESLTKYIKDNNDALYNTITMEKGNGSVTIKEVSNGRDKRIVKFTDGTTQEIDGTDVTAVNSYNNDVDLKRSVDALYEDLPQDQKAKFPTALDYWKETVYNSGGDVTTSRKVESKGGNTINFGGYSANSPYSVTPYQVDQRTNRTSDEGDNTTTRGFSVKKGATELSLKDVSPPFFYLSNSSAQTQVPAGTTVTLDGVSPFKAPAFSGNITFEQLKGELEKNNSWDDFLKKFGVKYKDAESSGSLNGIILTNKEVKFLQSAGLGKYIKDKKFAKGALSYYEPSSDPDEAAVLKRFNGAIMPLESIAPSIESETQIDFNRALDQFPDEDYNIFTKDASETKKPKEEVIKIKEDEVIIGEDYGAPKKTPFGKEYDSEDSKGYYFKGRMIEEKGR